MTAQLGFRPLYLHLMFMNFSNPISAPNPACTHPSHQLKPLISTLLGGHLVLQDDQIKPNRNIQYVQVWLSYVAATLLLVMHSQSWHACTGKAEPEAIFCGLGQTQFHSSSQLSPLHLPGHNTGRCLQMRGWQDSVVASTSVTTKPSLPTSLSPILSAMMDELPGAMLAKGPACTSTGVSSRVCIRVGSMASFISTARAPPTPRSSAVTGAPALPKSHNEGADEQYTQPVVFCKLLLNRLVAATSHNGTQ